MHGMRGEASLLITLIILLSLTPYHAEDRPNYIYTYYVSRDGYINVTIDFTGSGDGYSWLLVPRYEPWDIKIVRGNLQELENKAVSVFYNNYSFYYSGDPATFQISYLYRFGALIVEPNGAFFSTQITVSPRSTGSVFVVMPEDFKAKGSEPWWNKRWSQEGYTYYMYSLPPNEAGRILISFEVEDKGDLVKIEGDGITVNTPRRYIDVAENLTKIYSAVKREIERITHTTIEYAHVYFYVPMDMNEILELGYTPFSQVSNKLGDIYINLITVRMISGASEQAMLHEIIHHYLWKAGIDVSLLWVHEGLANYLSTEILKAKGYPVENLTYENLEEIPQITGDKYGFLEHWRVSSRPANIGLYYAASLYIIKTLGDQYGGLELYSKLFMLINKDKTILTTTDNFVDYLSQAAGVDLSQKFRKWGFTIGQPKIRNVGKAYLLYIIAGLIAVLLIVLIKEITRPTYYPGEEYYYIV